MFYEYEQTVYQIKNYCFNVMFFTAFVIVGTM